MWMIMEASTSFHFAPIDTPMLNVTMAHVTVM